MSRPLFCAPRHGLPLRFFFNVPSFSFPGRRPLPSGRGGPSPVAPGPGRFARTEAKPVPCGRLGRVLRFVQGFRSVGLKKQDGDHHPLVPFEPGARCCLPFFIQAAMPARPGGGKKGAIKTAGRETGKGKGPGGATRRPVWLRSGRAVWFHMGSPCKSWPYRPPPLLPDALVTCSVKSFVAEGKRHL